jgi:hypothetical protein
MQIYAMRKGTGAVPFDSLSCYRPIFPPDVTLPVPACTTPIGPAGDRSSGRPRWHPVRTLHAKTVARTNMITCCFIVPSFFFKRIDRQHSRLSSMRGNVPSFSCTTTHSSWKGEAARRQDPQSLVTNCSNTDARMRRPSLLPRQRTPPASSNWSAHHRRRKPQSGWSPENVAGASQSRRVNSSRRRRF